jgi:DNA primase
LRLRFATLPQGEDPDTLVLRHGADAMRAVLDRAQTLDEVMWTHETRQSHDTPERRAGLEKRLEARVRLIADRSVQEHYRRFIKTRLYQLWRAPRAGVRVGGLGRPWGRPVRLGPNDPTMVREGIPAEPTVPARRQHEILLAAILNHPFILHEEEQELAALDISAPDLDRLRREVLNTHHLDPDLDAAKLRLHLSERGFSRTVEAVLSRQVLVHAAFARSGADADAVRVGWKHTIGELQRRSVAALDVAEAERAFAEDMCEENGARLQQTLRESKREDDGTTEGEVR